MSSLENLLNRLTIDIAQKQEHYVYYDNETNRIHKISPIQQESNFESFSIESEIVEPILKGTARLDDYLVYFDYGSKKLNIKRKSYEIFSNISLIEVMPNNNSDVCIYLNNSNIKIKIQESLHNHATTDQNNLIFVITEKSNPYKLYYNFKIRVCDLLVKHTHEHQLTAEQIKNGVSIYTNPIFETYSLKVNYDTKISSN